MKKSVLPNFHARLSIRSDLSMSLSETPKNHSHVEFVMMLRFEVR